MQKIYMIPGLMTDKRLWSRVVPLLKNDFQLQHIPIPKSKSFDEVCTDLDKVLLEDNINLLGFSMGSYISAYYAIKNPQKIKKLFLVSGSVSNYISKEEVEKRKTVLEMIKKFKFKSLSDKKILSLIENKDDENLIYLIKDMYKTLGKETYISQVNLSFQREDISKEFTSLDIPIKILYSTKDRMINYEAFDYLQSKNFKNISLIPREGSSHFIPLDDPVNLAKEIKEWFS